MGKQNNFAALFRDFINRLPHAIDARCISDDAVFYRQVEIDAQ